MGKRKKGPKAKPPPAKRMRRSMYRTADDVEEELIELSITEENGGEWIIDKEGNKIEAVSDPNDPLSPEIKSEMSDSEAESGTNDQGTLFKEPTDLPEGCWMIDDEGNPIIEEDLNNEEEEEIDTDKEEEEEAKLKAENPFLFLGEDLENPRPSDKGLIFLCDICCARIYDIRWTCDTCKDLDLCDFCLESADDGFPVEGHSLDHHLRGIILEEPKRIQYVPPSDTEITQERVEDPNGPGEQVITSELPTNDGQSKENQDASVSSIVPCETNSEVQNEGNMQSADKEDERESSTSLLDKETISQEKQENTEFEEDRLLQLLDTMVNNKGIEETAKLVSKCNEIYTGKLIMKGIEAIVETEKSHLVPILNNIVCFAGRGPLGSNLFEVVGKVSNITISGIVGNDGKPNISISPSTISISTDEDCMNTLNMIGLDVPSITRADILWLLDTLFTAKVSRTGELS